MRSFLKMNLILAVIFLSTQITYADEGATLKAVEAATSWLKLVDAGDYDKSWEVSSSLVKDAVKKDEWSSSIRRARSPLGPVLSRSLESKHYATSLPGAPDGEYVVIQFQTTFQNKKSAVETVTPKRSAKGSWEVSGYYIR